MELTLRSVDAEVADVTYTGTITAKAEAGKEPANAVENGKVTGSIVLSRRDGFTVRGEAKTSMTVKTEHPQAGEVRIDIVVTTTLERDKGEQGKGEKDATSGDAPAPPKGSPTPTKGGKDGD
jgi:hypothetical protein